MTRIFLALATVIFASVSLMGSPARACISCEYTPQVVNTPSPHAAKRKKIKSYQAKRKPSAKTKTVRKKPSTTQAKAKPTPAPRQTAKQDVAKEEAVKEKVAKTETETETEEHPRVSGSSVLMQHSIPRQEKPLEAADAEGACKKFIPAVGATVSVACN